MTVFENIIGRADFIAIVDKAWWTVLRSALVLIYDYPAIYSAQPPTREE